MSFTIKTITLTEKFASISEQWQPKIIGRLNGQLIKIAKVQGDFVWHHHETEDEFFMVIEGRLFIELRDKTLELGPGECTIIPAGVEHRPYSEIETQIMLFEPDSTVNTGAVENDRTVRSLDEI